MEHALTIADKRERYEYVYDVICDYLDRQFAGNNYCDFVGDQCVKNRIPTSECKRMGCCYSLDCGDVKICKYFDMAQKICTVICLGCKLFVCSHLQKHGVRFNLNDFKGIRKIFTKNQLWFLSRSCLLPRDEIIDSVMELSRKKMPYFIFRFILFMSYSFLDKR